MSLASLRPRTMVTLCILVPVVCIGLGAFLVWPSLSHLGKLGHDLETTKKTIQQKQQVIAKAEATADGRSLVLAVVAPGAQERIAFLRQLARLTAESGATLAGVRETSPPPRPAAAPRPRAGSARRARSA